VGKYTNNVYSNNPTLDEFGHIICETITSIKVSKLKLVTNDLFDRLQAYEQKRNILSTYCDGDFF
jgi:hypothetical protein